MKLEHGIFFVVSKLKAKFVQAAKFNDLLFTETDLLYIKSASIGLEQRIFRNKTLIFAAEIKLACINQAGRPVKLPSEVKRNFKNVIKRILGSKNSAVIHGSKAPVVEVASTT